LADLEGRARPAGGAFDIGAYEFGALVGDYNRDGRVDEADYVLWRNTAGSTVTRYSGADGDGNGIIDQADYAIWRSGFGATGGAGSGIGAATVPEPCFIAEILVLAVVFSVTRQAVGRI
jgi:hypothetical protein